MLRPRIHVTERPSLWNFYLHPDNVHSFTAWYSATAANITILWSVAQPVSITYIKAALHCLKVLLCWYSAHCPPSHFVLHKQCFTDQFYLFGLATETICSLRLPNDIDTRDPLNVVSLNTMKSWTMYNMSAELTTEQDQCWIASLIGFFTMQINYVSV
jgi:hypothetical protein